MNDAELSAILIYALTFLSDSSVKWINEIALNWTCIQTFDIHQHESYWSEQTNITNEIQIDDIPTKWTASI